MSTEPPAPRDRCDLRAKQGPHAGHCEGVSSVSPRDQAGRRAWPRARPWGAEVSPVMVPGPVGRAMASLESRAWAWTGTGAVQKQQNPWLD